MTQPTPSSTTSAGSSLTSLRRWSCQDRRLPSVQQILNVHVYDFDNTLFCSPLPSKQLWNGPTCGSLQGPDFLRGGGWWHNPRILSAAGQGIAVEETRAWEGCWNEDVVQLVQLSMEQDNTLTVLLTGRGEDRFSDLLRRMIRAKGLVFDIIALKPAVGPQGDVFSSTMQFKQAFLKQLMYTYSRAGEIRMYEDRPKHVTSFRDFFSDFNDSLRQSSQAQRQPITAEVLPVPENETVMDPVSEVAEVQHMINTHNQAILDGTAPPGTVPYKIKRTVFFTGYSLQPSDTDRLWSLVKLPTNFPEQEVRQLANNILITPRPAPPPILDKVGGIGAKMTWRVTGFAVLENRLWAARVSPINSGAEIYTENPTPCVVLATRRSTKPADANRIQNWQPVPKHQAFEFETTVREKVLLRIEEEYTNEDEYEASFPSARNTRKHPRQEEFPPLGAQRGGKPNQHPQGGKQQQQQRAIPNGPARAGGGIGFAAQRGAPTGPRNQRGGRGGGGGGGGGARGGRGSGGGRGRGSRGYRSLDDSVAQGYGGGSMQY